MAVLCPFSKFDFLFAQASVSSIFCERAALEACNELLKRMKPVIDDNPCAQWPQLVALALQNGKKRHQSQKYVLAYGLSKKVSSNAYMSQTGESHVV